MIHELLLQGGTNALPAADIGRQIGMSERRVRKLVETERLAGIVILTGDGGYFLPSEDPNLAQMEIAAWMAQRTATSGTMLKTVEMARKALPDYAGT